jgi:hypothetical protein
MTRINLDPDYTQLPEGSYAQVIEWLEASGLQPIRIPSKGGYLVHTPDDEWYLVARRFVHDVHGKRIKHKIGDGYQKTIYITVPVLPPPSFLLPQENPS